VRADGEQCWHACVEIDRKRREAARAPQYQLAPAHLADDRIVDMAKNGAVVHQEQVGDAVEANERLVLVGADRLLGKVSAGGDDREPKLREQQVVQRGVRQHRAEVRITRRDRERQSVRL